MIRGSGFDDSTLKELINKRIRLNGRDVEGVKGRWRKVADVEGHDDISNASQGSSQDVTVIRVRQH